MVCLLRSSYEDRFDPVIPTVRKSMYSHLVQKNDGFENKISYCTGTRMIAPRWATKLEIGEVKLLFYFGISCYSAMQLLLQ